jgi:hypothetical protein
VIMSMLVACSSDDDGDTPDAAVDAAPDAIVDTDASRLCPCTPRPREGDACDCDIGACSELVCPSGTMYTTYCRAGRWATSVAYDYVCPADGGMK